MMPKAEGPTLEEEQAAYIREARQQRYFAEMRDLQAEYRASITAAKPTLDLVALLLLSVALSAGLTTLLKSLADEAWSDRQFLYFVGLLAFYFHVQGRIFSIVTIFSKRALLYWLYIFNFEHPDNWRSVTFIALWRGFQTFVLVMTLLITFGVAENLARVAKALPQAALPSSPPASLPTSLPPLP